MGGGYSRVDIPEAAGGAEAPTKVRVPQIRAVVEVVDAGRGDERGAYLGAGNSGTLMVGIDAVFAAALAAGNGARCAL
ncbi:unnamed protein product, partial [Closterium sp. NIES-64]